MKSIVIKLLVNAVALWTAALLLNGIRLDEGNASLSGRLVTVLWVSVIFVLVNALIKPVLKL